MPNGEELRKRIENVERLWKMQGSGTHYEQC